MRKIRRESGFTLIELLIVVAIIGIIAAIAIPNLLNAIDRGKQKRTMSDMRSIGTSVESYAVDVNFYPIAALGNVSLIAPLLEPVYIKNTPEKDGWSHDIQYACDSGGVGSDYTIVSPGKNGVFAAAPGATNDFDCDIIFENGTFTAYPEGVQT